MPYSSVELLDCSEPILVFGRDGQIGKALQIFLKNIEVPVIFLGRSDCDLLSANSIDEVLNRYQPKIVINVAAYTAVDQAESQADLALAVNARAPEIMAQYVACQSQGVFIHYSSDYVFTDTQLDPYLETDQPGPMDQLCVYGQSKLAGEEAIAKAFDLSEPANPEMSRYYILRTSWVYGDGHNFIKTMLRLAAERSELKVVMDQWGVPTSASWLAELAVQLLGSQAQSGIYHCVPDGETSWHALAVYAIDLASASGHSLALKSENILPIPSSDYVTAAKRPHNSRLNHAKLKRALSEMAGASVYPEWQEHVKSYVQEYVQSSSNN
jgi:dTDP-4-dehydrorhamnose reductase